MKQLDKVELFVCSEDATQPIGFADEVEVWTEGDGTTLILRGVNGVDKDAVLQAENECLRRDVEFYKNRAPTKPTITAGAAGRHSYLLGADFEIPRVIDYLEALGIEVIPDPEPTNTDRLRELHQAWINECGDLTLSEYFDKHGVTAPNAKGSND